MFRRSHKQSTRYRTRNPSPRPESVSNPYRGSSTGAATYSYYDSLGRPVAVVHHDGSSARLWCYSGITPTGLPKGLTPYCTQHSSNGTGTWVDITDENGNHWQESSDSFGELTRVVEPNGAKTYYAYDGLGNLTCAVQDGGSGGAISSCSAAPSSWRPRNFSYDSLSRLLASANPESGSLHYTYDANGNMSSKTDARGVQVSYVYDLINRVVSKAYSDSSTPASCYQYDTAVRGVGRLSNAWTQPSSTGCSTAPPASPSGFLTLRSILSYDAMGRILNEQQFGPSSATTGTSTPPATPCGGRSLEVGISYCYDLTGNLTYSTNGVNSPSYQSGQASIGFTESFDSAGRLQNLSSSWYNPSDPTHPENLFSSQSYLPFGALMNGSYGGSLTLSRNYDIRFRMTGESDFGNPAAAIPGSASVAIPGTALAQ